MKNKNDFYYIIMCFIIGAILIAFGITAAVFGDRSALFGYAFIIFGALFFVFVIYRVVSKRSVEKEKSKNKLAEGKKEIAAKNQLDEAVKSARNAFEKVVDYPEINTLKIKNAGMEFSAAGSYVCKKDFKGKSGYHFAFEINSQALKFKPEDYDDVCDLESVGVLIEAGYFDGVALEKYANDNGIMLPSVLGNCVGQTLTLKYDGGYSFNVTTAETDEAAFGFVKILKSENGVLTVFFEICVPYGLNDVVTGTVGLKLENEEARDIDSLISKIKRKRFNTIEVDGEEVQAIERENGFLPESYIRFLREIGFADMGWIDVGWNEKTPANLNDDSLSAFKENFADVEGVNPEDYYFFGIDNDDGYYAFSKDAADKKVYNFSGDSPRVFTYDTFEDFLYEILNV